MAHPTFPDTEDSALAAPASASTQASVADLLSIGRDAKATLKVLVVDDELTLRETCASILRLEGYNVRDCGRGEEALDLLKRE